MTILLSLSGGLDSASLLGLFKESGIGVIGVSFNYGAKHNKYENQAARDVADYYDTELIEMDITGVMEPFKSNLLLTGGDIPEGHYEADNMKSTVVPARNMIFLSIMTGLAISKECHTISLGVHGGDHAIYPDCRPEFIDAMAGVVDLVSEANVQLTTPFLFFNKANIIKEVCQFKKAVPFHLTRTCYKDQELACGKCGSCIERLEAFGKNHLFDLVEYERSI